MFAMILPNNDEFINFAGHSLQIKLTFIGKKNWVSPQRVSYSAIGVPRIIGDLPFWPLEVWVNLSLTRPDPESVLEAQLVSANDSHQAQLIKGLGFTPFLWIAMV